MFKMLKYEYRRGIFSLFVIFAAFLVEEAFFLWATYSHEENYIGLSMGLYFMLSFACYVFVLIRGVYIFNHDLKNKDGYMVFMTPISSYQIVGAKLLCTLLSGVTLLVMIVGFAIANFQILLTEYNLKSILDMLKQMIEVSGTEGIKNALLEILSLLIVFLISFFLMITVAYFSTALSATLLQNKKGKTLISILIFIMIYAIIIFVADKISDLNSNQIQVASDILFKNLPLLGFYLVSTIVAYIGTSELLDKKISL